MALASDGVRVGVTQHWWYCVQGTEYSVPQVTWVLLLAAGFVGGCCSEVTTLKLSALRHLSSTKYEVATAQHDVLIGNHRLKQKSELKTAFKSRLFWFCFLRCSITTLHYCTSVLFFSPVGRRPVGLLNLAASIQGRSRTRRPGPCGRASVQGSRGGPSLSPPVPPPLTS